MKKTLVLCFLTITLTGCSWSWPWGKDSSNDEYNNLVTQAENEIKLADKTGFLWRDTEKFLKESKEAKAAADKARTEGDRVKASAESEKAMKLANKALKQAQMAQLQATDNANPVVRFE